MKTAKITAPADYFVNCPYCDRYHETNVDGDVIECECGNKFRAVYDSTHFMNVAESNIYDPSIFRPLGYILRPG